MTVDRASGERADMNRAEPGSEAITRPLRDQEKKRQNVHDLSSSETPVGTIPGGVSGPDDETPAEHVRNALMLLAGMDWMNPASSATLNRRFVDAAELRLRSALAKLEARPVSEKPPCPHGFGNDVGCVQCSGRLKLVDDSDGPCAFCGCTDVAPCDLKRDELTPLDRRTIDEYFRERGELTPELVPCWWMPFTDRPVCSRPACVNKYAAEMSELGL